MITIIGLGNMGDEYKMSRHNVAWIIFDELISPDRWQDNKYAEADLASTRIGDTDVMLVKPLTFMNESGRVLPYLMKTYGTTAENLVVLQDDIDLPFGTIKISHDRGDGGHNGIKSIMKVLESKEFTRIRVGVSIVDETGTLRKPDVLGNFSKDEQLELKDISQRVGKIIETITLQGREKAMTNYN